MIDYPLELADTYFHIEGENGEVIAVDDSFWPDVMSGKRKIDGWLVACRPMGVGTSAHAEMHPHGDEILILMSGKLDVVFEAQGAEENVIVPLQPGRACFVSRGTWHWQRVHEPSQMLALTCGKGTQHKTVPA